MDTLEITQAQLDEFLAMKAKLERQAALKRERNKRFYEKHKEGYREKYIVKAQPQAA